MLFKLSVKNMKKLFAYTINNPSTMATNTDI